MRRNVQLFHLAQARSVPLSRRLSSKPPSEWPEHVKLAWAILRDELEVTEERAFRLIHDSILAAQKCADGVNSRSRNIAEANARAKICLAFKRLGKCCWRASVGVRRRLDEAIVPLLAQDPIDSEVIEAILEAVATEFELFSWQDAAATALRAMVVTIKGHDPNNWLKNDYLGLRRESQRSCEAALSKLAKKRSAKAHMVFDALATAINKMPAGKKDPETTDFRSNFVSDLASLWRTAGLYPGRACHPGDSSYKSRFHRYSDLILTAVGEPWAQRHTGDLAHIRRRTHKARAVMPREYRASAALPPSAAEWLITERILRKGLRQRLQK